MFHRVGLRVGVRLSEGEYERAPIFCSADMVVFHVSPYFLNVRFREFRMIASVKIFKIVSIQEEYENESGSKDLSWSG